MNPEDKKEYDRLTGEIKRLTQQWNKTKSHDDRLKYSAAMKLLEKQRMRLCLPT